MAAPGDGEDQKCLNKHGYPHGVHFVPEDHELLAILDDKLRGAPLDRAHDAVFHDTQILDFHPAKLYEMYAEDEEEGYIYFFSAIQFRGKKMVERAAQGGQWRVHKSKTVEAGGVAVGRKISMHFDDHSGDNDPVGTNWGMQEFARFIGPENELADLAVYRLYKKKIIKKGGEKPEDGGHGAATATADASAWPAWNDDVHGGPGERGLDITGVCATIKHVATPAGMAPVRQRCRGGAES